LLERLLADQISDAEQEVAGAHVRACPHCQQILETLTAFKATAPSVASRAWPNAAPLSGGLVSTASRSAIRAGGEGLRETELRWLRQLLCPPTPLDRPEMAAAAPVQADWPMVPGYEILGELGRGGMGNVYRARQLRLNRLVALKLVRADSMVAPAQRPRFLVEGEVLARLQHPNVVQIYDIGFYQGQPYFALELVEGGSLAAKLNGKPLPARQAAQLAACLAQAVHAAHAQRIIHRDLKPANVLLTADDVPKLTDFGLAKTLDVDLKLTRTGEVLGTPAYMAPEQALGQATQIGPLTDVYALGVILYETLTGRPPFLAATCQEVLQQVSWHEPVPPRRLQPQVPRDLETICLRCLQKEPRKRYANAGELADDVRRFLGGEPIRARPVGRAERLARWCRRNPTVASLAAAFVSTLLFGLAGVSWKWLEAKALAQRNQQLAQENQAALLKAETTLVDMQTSRGLLAGERGEAALAALWFAKAAQQAATDPRRQADDRLRAWNWIRDAVLPVGACSLNLTTQRIEFRPGDDLLMIQAGQQLFVWDWRQDKVRDWSDGKGNVSAACWSRDGASLVVGLLEGGVQLRKAPDGTLLLELAYPGAITALAYSPDGHYLAIASTVVRLWDVQTQRFLPVSWQHPQVVEAVAFNAKGNRLVTACRDKKARVYVVEAAANRQEPLFVPVRHEPMLPSAPAFINGDRGLVTVTGKSQLTWWDAESGKPARTLTTTPRDLHRVVASPRGDWFATCGVSAAQVWNAAQGAGKSVVLNHRNIVKDFVFSPDGATVVTASIDETARLWSLPLGQTLGSPLAHLGMVNHCTFSGDQVYLATARPDGQIRIWKRPAHDQVQAQLKDCGPRAGARARVSFSNLLIAPGYWHERPYDYDGMNRLVVLEARTGKPAGPEIRVPGTLFDSCVCADDRSVAAVSVDGEAGWLSFWDVPTGRALMEPRKLTERPQSVAARPRSSHAAVLCANGALQVFDSRTGKQVFDLRHQGWQSLGSVPYPRVEYTADGTTLVSLCCYGGSVNVWDAETGRLRYPPVRPILQGDCCRSFVLSADAQLLATAVNGNNAAQIWDLASGRALSGPLLHPGDVFGLYTLAFSLDSRLLLTGCKDGQARLWDWQAGKLACPPLKHQDEIFAVALTADGQHALTAGRFYAKTLNVWELTTGKLAAPPLQVGEVTSLAISPDGKRVVAAASDSVFLINLADLLAPPEMSTEDLSLLSELATAQQIELGDVSGLTLEQWLERWHRFRLKYPAFGQDKVVQPGP
jgi:WD40 repeat protein